MGTAGADTSEHAPTIGSIGYGQRSRSGNFRKLPPRAAVPLQPASAQSGADVGGRSPVPAQMWAGCAQSRRRCGRGEPGPGMTGARDASLHPRVVGAVPDDPSPCPRPPRPPAPPVCCQRRPCSRRSERCAASVHRLAALGAAAARVSHAARYCGGIRRRLLARRAVCATMQHATCDRERQL